MPKGELRWVAHLPFVRLEPIGGWTTKSVTHGQCVVFPASESPHFDWYQVILLGDRGTQM